MDFDLRDSLLILGPLFIVAILLHGYWRMRRNQNRLKMSLDRNFMSSPGENFNEEEDIEMLRAELPNGGARVRTIPEQTALDLDEDVPVLMEPVAEDPAAEDDRHEEAREEAREEAPAPVIDQESVQEEPVEETRVAAPVAADRPEYFVVVYVTAVGQPFTGQRLLECLVDNNMQFGEMSIFHRHGSGEFTEFSLVNAVEPGTFDMNTIDSLKTPAVSLFMRVHEQPEPVRVFDEMISVAESLANELGGEVKDETRSVLTPQTVEHGREKIRAYQLKHG